MSVVAYKNGVIAADSGWSTDTGIVLPPTSKLWKVGSVFIGFAGNYAEAVAFLRWLGSDRSKPRPTCDGVSALALVDDRIFRLHSNGMLIRMDSSRSYAIGSGYEVALGAMEYGARAVDSVDIAIRLLESCAAPVCWADSIGVSMNVPTFDPEDVW